MKFSPRVMSLLATIAVLVSTAGAATKQVW